MADVTEYINDRIDRYMKNTDIIHCTMGRITELPNYDKGETKYRVEIIQANTNYALVNFTGSQLQVGQHVKVFYKNYLNERNAWIGESATNENKINGVSGEGITNLKVISQSEYDRITPDNSTVYFVTGSGQINLFLGDVAIGDNQQIANALSNLVEVE